MIDITLFDLPYTPRFEAVVAALVAGQDRLSDAATAALRLRASFSERYLSSARAAQVAARTSAALCATLAPEQREQATQALFTCGCDLANDGLLREAVAQLSVAWMDSTLDELRATAPANERDDWLAIGAALMARVNASISAGFEEERRQRIMAQQEEMNAALMVTLQQREVEEAHLRDMIDELSMPVIPILPGLLVLPIVGSIDTARAERLTETVLTHVSGSRVHTVLLDITGVAVVDTYTATALLNTARAVRLLGASTSLVGIRPEIAQTVVGLGMDLTELYTFADLEAGLRHALRLQGLTLTKIK